jgi:hypothetical protein
MGAGGNGVQNARTQDFRRIDSYPTILEHEVASGQAAAYSRVSYLQNGNVTTVLHDFQFTREAGPSSFAYVDRFWNFTPTTPMNYELSGYMQIDSSPNDVVIFMIGLAPLNSIGLFGYGSEYSARNDYRDFGFETDGTFIDYTGNGQSTYSGSPAGVLSVGTLYTVQFITGIAAESADITVPATARGRITLTLTAVPEPSVGMLLGMLGGSLATMRRRRSPG